MKVAPFVIERFAKWIVGGVEFETVKRVSSQYHEAGMTGEEKRQTVLNEMKLYSYALGGFLLNLAIELAVAWLKSKYPTK